MQELLRSLQAINNRSLLYSTSIQLLDHLPSSLVLEEDWSTIVTNSHDSGVIHENKIQEWQVLSLDLADSRIPAAYIGNSERGVMSNVGKEISIGAPFDGLRNANKQ